MIQEGILTVGIFIYDGVEVLDFCGPFEVFSGASSVGEPSQHRQLFQVIIIAEEDRIITCAGGAAGQASCHHRESPISGCPCGAWWGRIPRTL
jgi:hypothetical protein